jgi:hypothetical protein
MADNTNTTPTPAAANDRVVASTPGTRRTSTSSAGNMADQASQATREQSSESARKPRPRPLDYGGSPSRFTHIHMNCPLTTFIGSIPSSSSTRPQSVTPQTPRRPGPAKRAPSSKKPFRGAEFSVDDEVDEVDNDLKLVRQKTRDNIHNERASLRRRRHIKT